MAKIEVLFPPKAYYECFLLKTYRHFTEDVEIKGEMTHPTAVKQVMSAFHKVVFLPDF